MQQRQDGDQSVEGEDAVEDDYGFGTSEEWEQWPESDYDSEHGDEDDDHVPDAEADQAADRRENTEEAGSSAAAEADVAAASSSAGAAGSSTADLANPNPAIRDPVNTALSTAVTNRLAAVQLQAQQQAAAAAASAAAAAANPVGLQELRLSGSSAWADDGLRQLLQGPVTKHSLGKLDISGCKGLTSAGLVIPPLVSS